MGEGLGSEQVFINGTISIAVINIITSWIIISRRIFVFNLVGYEGFFFIQQGATHKSIFFNDISRERPRRWGSDKRARKRDSTLFQKSTI